MTYQKILWGSVVAILAVDVLWLSFSSFKISYNEMDFLLYISFVSLFYIPYLIYKYLRPDPNIMMTFLSFCWFFCFAKVALILSYLAYTTDYPLITSSLADIDQDLGFYAPSLVLWFRHHPSWNIVFSIIYNSFLFQKPFTLLYLSLRGQLNHLESFMMQYMIAGVLAIVIGAALPAVGTYIWYHFPPNPGQLSDMEQLYALRENIVDLDKLNGIVEFPSFHTASALIYTYAFRDENKFIFIPILFLNILLIFSCLSHGGHFLIDIFGGIAVAIIAIGIERFLFKSIKLPVYKEKKNVNGEIPKVL